MVMANDVEKEKMNKTGKSNEEYRLIKNILSGQGEHYRTLVDRYSAMVFHVVRGFVNDSDEVEELSQQIFVKAYEKLDRFQMDSKFSTWLYSIARNHCRDYAKNIRRNNSRVSEMEEDFLETNYTNEQTPHMNLELKEWGHLLNRAMKSLSEDYSKPFLMKYRDGMSYRTMSETTGVSESALKVRVHRARKELKTLLENEV